MMVQPEPAKEETEEIFEWIIEDGQRKKITEKNSNGRKCLGCGCSCPCKCLDCKPFCCSRKVKKETEQ